MVNGTAGNDRLTGSANADTLDGLGGEDTLIGRRGKDILIGGAGDDYLSGGEDADQYIFDLGWGHDTIYEGLIGGTGNVIEFGAAIRSEDFSFTGEGDDLIVVHSGGDTIRLERFLPNPWDVSLNFADGTVLAGRDLQVVINGTAADEEFSGTHNADTIVGGAGNDRVYAGSGDDLIEGNAGSDSLYGFGGDDLILGGDGDDTLSGQWDRDTLIGGAGDDYLSGGEDADRYIFNSGWGHDRISEGVLGGTGNVIEFGSGIRSEDFSFTGENDDLIIVHSSGDTIRLEYFIPNPWDVSLNFADGTVLSGRDIQVFIEGTAADEEFSGTHNADTILGGAGNDRVDAGSGDDLIEGNAGSDSLYGFGGDDLILGGDGDDTLLGQWDRDTLIGGAGDDYLSGGEDADRYIFNLGWGRDTISEGTFDGTGNVIEFGAEVSADDLTLTRLGDDLIATHSNGDTITINNHFGSVTRFSQVVFADGTVLSPSEWIVRTVSTPGNDTRNGTADNDTLNGLEGDDLLNGFGGDDDLYGEAGNDTLRGGEDFDYLYGGAGDDLLIGGNGQDSYWFGPAWGNDTINNYDTAVVDANGIVSPSDAIRFLSGVDASDISGHRDGSNLVLSHLDGSSITVLDHFISYDAEINYVDFDDGTYWGLGILDAVPEQDPNAQIIEAEGLGVRLSGGNIYQITFAIGVWDLTLGGAAVGPTTLPGWQPIMAQIGTEFGADLLWQNEDGAHLVWGLDNRGNWVSTTDLMNANMETVVNYEVVFDADLNNDGAVGHTVTDIDTTGVGLQSSTRNTYHIVDGSDVIDLS
ncbi:calcium-binding protein, partial [uncultured Roseobacter sp.]|uniref:calcium-binding protein n=1 Tax=uncultured Roseobacter sp. TaxID=114847 RepID=UPI00260FA814